MVVPRLGRAGLQVAAVLIGAGAWWLRDIIAAHGLATSSAELIGAQLVLGAGIGMLISPLFDFILASVRDHEVGSASGVLNAVQQLAGAIGVAAIGTIFFSTLSLDGFTAAISQSLEIQLGIAAVLFGLAWALPRRPREDEAPEAESAEAETVEAENAEIEPPATAARPEPVASARR